MDQIIDTSFSSTQLGVLTPSLIFFLCSLIFFLRGKHNIALALLFLGAIGLRVFMIILDPFLNDWDERFHALVAKNMMTHPFKPMLWANPVLDYDYKQWCCNHIWLHKQPFFLWQMALSMKLFGVNEVAIRIPSVLLGAIQVLLVYRIGLNLRDKELGYIAAFLFAMSYYQLELTSGFMGREHNDLSFIFYVTAGFWALFEYLNTEKKVFLILVGIFTGIAILNKWLVGLLVFGGWGLATLLLRRERINFLRYKDLAIAFFVTVLVAAPWQIYILLKFPQESAFVYGFHQQHLFKTFDEQGGGYFYYFEENYRIYGDWSWIVILVGMLFFLRLVKSRLFKVICLSSLVAVYVFFSLVGTKSLSYVFVINFVIFLFGASFLIGVLEWIPKYLNDKYKMLRPAILFMLMLLFGFLTLQHWKIEEHPLGLSVKREQKIHNTEIYKKLNDLVPEGYVVFNCADPIEAMFYADRTCYFWIEPDEYNMLKSQGIKMAAFKDYKYTVPFYLRNDPEVLIIDATIMR